MFSVLGPIENWVAILTVAIADSSDRFGGLCSSGWSIILCSMRGALPPGPPARKLMVLLENPAGNRRQSEDFRLSLLHAAYPVEPSFMRHTCTGDSKPLLCDGRK